MTKITVVLPDLDDCDRATLVGLITEALATDERLTRALLFRRIGTYEVRDDEPLTYSESHGSVLQVGVGFPATVEYVRTA